ncbi:MAG: SoxR reducing system RseC family protein [Arenimonas sp.]|nr:SoxR reducing system RseC family protein [Arenimonas sp.]
MAEREVQVCAIQDGRVQLRLMGSACDGCQGGCAGRCSLFATNQDGLLWLPLAAGAAAAPGQRLRLHLDDRQLRRAAWRGYGWAWLGLLAGAGLGSAAGWLLEGYANVFTLAGLLAGTFAAVRFSKRHLPEPRLLSVQAPDFPSPSSDPP